MTRTRFLFLAIAIVIGALHTFEVEAVDSVFGVPLPQSGHESIGANISNFCENLVSVCTCVACTSPGTCQRILDTVDPRSRMDQTLPVPKDDTDAQWTQDNIDSRPEAQTPRLTGSFFPDLTVPVFPWLDAIYTPGDRDNERLAPDYSHNTAHLSVQQSDSMYPTSLPHLTAESDLMDVAEPATDPPRQDLAVLRQQPQGDNSTIWQTPAPLGEALDRNNAEKTYMLPDHWSSMVSISPPPDHRPRSHDNSTHPTPFLSFNIAPSLTDEPSPVLVPQLGVPVQGRLKCPQCKKVFNKQPYLQSHIKRQHERKVKRYKCPEDDCSFTTDYPKDLRKHKPSHTNAHDFCCIQCESSFTRQDNLNRHVADQHAVSSS